MLEDVKVERQAKVSKSDVLGRELCEVFLSAFLYHQEGETRNFLHVFSVALILKMIFDQLFRYYC